MNSAVNNTTDNKRGERSLFRTSIYFGKKDGFLCEWVQSLPRGSFGYIVRDAIVAYLNNDKEYVIPQFSYKKKEYKKSFSMALSLNKEDHDVYTYITSLDPYDRSNQIKKILRYYLTKDRAKPVLLKPPSKPERVNTKNEEVIFKNKNKSVVKPVISKSNNLSKGIKAQLLKESKDMDYGSYS